MASGIIHINLSSIDYTGALPSGTCCTSANYSSFGRGTAHLDTSLNWTVNDSNLLSFSYGGSSGVTSWYVCSVNGYHLEVQWSSDQSNWTTIASSYTNDYQSCVASRTVVLMAQELIAALQPVVLTESGYIRIYTWTPNACPTSDLPNAYPTQYGSQAVAIPIYIEVSWDAYLRYDCNGGSGCPSTQSRTVREVETTQFTIPNNTPTWEWHRFEGYSFNRSASTGDYHPGDTVTISKSDPDKTLYAIWTEYYRPGAVLTSNGWKSHQRSGGACSVKENGTWVEKRTIDGGTRTNDPPQIKRNDYWENMHRIGSET